MFDPDYRTSPWNKSRYAPSNSGYRDEKGKGNAITAQATGATAIPVLIFGIVPLWYGLTNNNMTILFVGLIISALLFAVMTPLVARDIRRHEYDYLKQHTSSAIVERNEKNIFYMRVWDVLADSFRLWVIGFLIVFLSYIDQNRFDFIHENVVVILTVWLGISCVIIYLYAKQNNRKLAQAISIYVTSPQQAIISEPTTLPPSIKSLDLTKLTAEEFEHEIAWIISNKTTHKVSVTPYAGDGGVDIEVRHKDTDKIISIVQCKRYKPNKPLPPSHIRELYAVKHKSGAKTAILATTAYFTNATKQEAKGFGITLWDGRKIQAMHQDLVSKIQ